MLKSYWVVVVVVGGLQDFSVSPRPLGFGGFWLRGLGPGLDNNMFESNMIKENIIKEMFKGLYDSE